LLNLKVSTILLKVEESANLNLSALASSIKQIWLQKFKDLLKNNFFLILFKNKGTCVVYTP